VLSIVLGPEDLDEVAVRALEDREAGLLVDELELHHVAVERDHRAERRRSRPEPGDPSDVHAHDPMETMPKRQEYGKPPAAVHV
jgi:hypothetical protein